MLLSIAPQARGFAVFPLWCPASVCVSMDGSLFMSHTLLRGVCCLCMCVQSNSSASGQSARRCRLRTSESASLLAPVLPLPLSSPPLLFSSSPPSLPPLSSSSSSSSSESLLSTEVSIYIFQPLSSLSLYSCLIFVLCVNQASLSLSHSLFSPLSRLHLISFPFPSFHLFLLLLLLFLSRLFPQFFPFLISVPLFPLL